MGDIIKRRGGYTLRWYEGGRRRVMASQQTTHADARRMLLEIEARVARGEAGIPEKRQASPLTVLELVERFLAEYSRPAVKNPARYRAFAQAALRRTLPQVGRLGADSITQLHVSKLRDSLGQKYAPASVKITLAFLSTLFAWARREGLVAANPCAGIERPRPESSVDYLSRDEAGLLIEAAGNAGKLLHACVALALHTGLRKGELFGLRWRDLDLDTRRLTVARSYGTTPKSGKVRHLRLPSLLVPILREWRASCALSSDGVVFPLSRSASKIRGRESMLGLPRLMAEVGLRPAAHPWHLLRHTFASHFVMSGGNILALQRILGHSDIKMTMVYAHLAPDFLDGEMERVSFAKGTGGR